MRSASFARQQNFAFFGARGCDLGRLVFERMFMIFVVLFGIFLVGRLVLFEFDVIAKSRDVQRIFVCRVGLGFRDGLGGAQDFPDRRLVFFFVLVVFLAFGEFFLFRFFFFFHDFFFFEDRAAGNTVSLHDFADFILFCINQAVGERSALFVAQLDAIFSLFGDGLGFLKRLDFLSVEFGGFLRLLCCGFGVFTGDFGRFRASAR